MKKHIALLFVWCCLYTNESNAQVSFDTSGYIRNNPALYNLVLSVGDSIRYSHTFNGVQQGDLLNDQSLTKSICALLIGIAIDKGYIGSVDEKISTWFPELKADSDGRKRTITLRQIMNQASGMAHEDLDSPDGVGDYLSLPDPSGYILKAPLVSTPGTVFFYNNAASHLLSLVLTRSTGMNTLAFARKYLFDPLGIREVEWAKMNDGFYDGGGLQSIQLRTQDLIRLGSLLLHGGKYQGQQIVSAKWIGQLLKPDIAWDTRWGFPHSRYALCWYHCRYQGTDLVYCLGWGGQFLIVIPDRKAIIAINQDHRTGTPQQSILFTQKIFPLIFAGLR